MNILKKISSLLLSIALIITGINVNTMTLNTVKAASTQKEVYPNFLKTEGKEIKNTNGDTVYLRGVNAGGYMLQEIWLCATKGATSDDTSGNIRCQQDIINKITDRLGSEKAKELINTYEENYWTSKDFENCARLGVNCIRLPIWYRNLVDENGNWYSNAFERLDWFIETAGRYGIYVIIDMHGAYGSQNGSHNSGIYGGSTNQQKRDNSKLFFGTDAATNQAKFYEMWYKIADHYKNNPVVAGYDLLNEPMADYMSDSGLNETKQERLSILWNVYDKAYKRIRTVDTNHIIMMEAVWDPDTLPKPTEKGWENVVYEYHQYMYGDYDNASGTQISSMQSKIDSIKSVELEYNVPSYIGEFNYMSNNDTWNKGVKLLNDNNLNWTIWNYKCTKQYGNWGLYNTPGNGSDSDTNNYWADVENDSYDTILSKWSKAGESTENTELTSKIKDYFPGVVESIATSKVKSVSGVNAQGMLNSINVTWYPKADMNSNTKYNIYVDDSTTPAMTVNQSVVKVSKVTKKATDYSSQNGIVNDKKDGVDYNIGGTHNGDWTKYDDISLSSPATSLLINYSCEKGNSGMIYFYEDSMDGEIIGSLKVTPPKTDALWSDYVTAIIDLYKPLSAGKHTVYMKFVNNTGKNIANVKDFTFICPSATATIANVEAGKHSVSIQASVDEAVSSEDISNEVEVVTESSIIKTDKISIKGFQIKTNGNRYYNASGEVVFDEEGAEKVAFRTICRAPAVGETITVSDKSYKVKNVGIIYTIDPNATGDETKDVFDSSYSVLNTSQISGAAHTYIGAKRYNGNDYTLGYLATDDGILSNKDGYMEYVRTVRNNSYYGSDGSLNVITNSFHARAFVVAEDGTIIYGNNVESMSIPEVAYYFYKNAMSSNYNGHAYLYDTILSRISGNKYFLSTKVDYGWNDNLYDPGK